MVLLAAGAIAVGSFPVWAAQSHPAIILSDGHSTQGYLGVAVGDVDNQQAAALKMAEPHGAEIINVDHDAPAGKAGLKVHDVILAMNGETIESQAQLRRMLRETPAGRTIHLQILRDGRQQDITVQLANRAELEANAWPAGPLISDNALPAVSLETPAPPSWFMFDSGPGGHLHDLMMFGGGGLDVEPLGKQLADFFGVPGGGGLLVRRVEPKSDAAKAGLQAGDVITRANGQPISTMQAWLMVLSQEQGKPIQLKVVRDHKEESLSYTPAVHSQGDLEIPALDAETVHRLAQQVSEIDPARLNAQIRRSMLQVQQLDLPRVQEQLELQMRNIQPQLDRQMEKLKAIQPQLDQQMKQLQEKLDQQLQVNDFD